jgi:hypothetical protein
LVAQPFGQAVASFGAGEVRLAGDVTKIAFGMCCVGNRAQFLFAREFSFHADGRKTRDASICLSADRYRRWKKERDC